MKLASVQIKNLRSCKDAVVPFNKYTCLVGPNGAGKSTILTALNIFFRETQQPGLDTSRLTQEDFHQKNTSEPITITLTFTDLNADAQEDFKDYYRNGKLVITTEAVFDEATQRAEVQQYGQRLVMPELAPFFKAEGDGVKVAELKTIYNTIRETITDLPTPGTKDAMMLALREYENTHQDRCKLLPSKDEFYGISKGKNRLEKYLQWVFVPAVKDASTEQLEQRSSSLGRLLARTVRAKTKFDEQVDTIRKKAQQDYQTLLETNQQTLNELSTALQKRLTDWAHPDATLRLEWWQDPDKAVSVQEPAAHIVAGEDTFEGQLCRLGHGLQRSYLIALLQELATTNDVAAPTLILGCEEPELYQHPPQARHLFQVFQTLAQQNAQVIVSTHSPYFVSGQMFEDVRLVHKDPLTKASRVTNITFEQIAAKIAEVTGEPVVKPQGMRAKIHQALQANLNEMFFTQQLIIVEGLEDIAYITTYLHLSNQWDEFRRNRCHMVAADGKDRIIQPLAIAHAIGIRTLVVFDSDGEQYALTPGEVPNGFVARNRPAHIRDNNAIQQLCGITNPDPFPTQTFYSDRLVMWHSDIGSVVAQDIGPDWQTYRAQADQELGQPGGLQKNGMHIALALTKAWDAGKRSMHLEQLCHYILQLGAPAPATMTAGSAPLLVAPQIPAQAQAQDLRPA